MGKKRAKSKVKLLPILKLHYLVFFKDLSTHKKCIKDLFRYSVQTLKS
uniref:Uncharacterized protein n=1 Tax=Rhizophora mucronata TaxID=61149 RepID=A0A2P2QAS7_RHIMU